jgi:hypothetical protein
MMPWEVHVARMAAIRNSVKFQPKILKVKHHLEKLDVDGRIIFSISFRK